jgi:5-methylcytosine-specific restriction endonuclease McrA
MATKRKWHGERITATHIRKAAKLWEKEPGTLGFRESTKYDVYVEGKPFPPKAISALAYQFATGETLLPSDFPGALDGYWHGILKNFYPIFPKSSVFTNEQDLDATEKIVSKLSYEQLIALADETSTETPFLKEVTRRVYQRSIYVRRAALLGAKGTCQKCNKPAPFKKKTNGEPYLEVHHKIPLSRDGADSLENVIAVCPNCHAQIHDEMNLDKSLD